MGLGKKFSQFGQSIGEKLGSSSKTETSEEFKRLKNETEQRRDYLQKVHDAFEAYLMSMTQQKQGLFDKSKKTVLEGLATTMVSFGATLPYESGYGQALMRFGETHEKIAISQIDYATVVKDTYMRAIQELLNECEQYSQIKKKLENRRLDYDAKQNKLSKSKKESPELEEEVRVAQMKYEDSLQDISNKMIFITATDDSLIDELTQIVDSGIQHHKKSMDLLNSLSDTLKKIPRNTAPVNREINLERLQNYRNNKSPSRRPSERPLDDDSRSQISFKREDSVDNIGHHTATYAPPSYSSQASISVPTQPVPVPSVGPSKQVRALYDFDAENMEEMSIRVGEIINVVREIDEGWWQGELADGSGRRGMFPSNYVEVIKSSPPKPRPPPRQTSQSDLRSSSHISLQASNTSLNDHRSRQPSVVPSQPDQKSRQQSFVASNPDRSRQGSQQGINVMPLPSQADNSEVFGPCSTCGCSEYRANAFKPGQCISCYHKH